MKLDFDKGDGLLPAVVQDAGDGTVLMLGYMNEEALEVTKDSGRVTFYSRSKGRLWTKGETSGNWLLVEAIAEDCDGDALLILAHARGPTCHTGSRSCFGGEYSFTQGLAFLGDLARVIQQRRLHGEDATSYTSHLLTSGTKRIAQKVGEEAVELVLEAAVGDHGQLIGESADLVYHLMVLLESCGLSLTDVVEELEVRHTKAGG